jgi:predicted nucleic acid-binding Zn ribbon protein
MYTADSEPEARPQAARAGVVASSLACPVCHGPLPEGRKVCSGRCRAALSRHRRQAAQAERVQEVRALLERAMWLLTLDYV